MSHEFIIDNPVVRFRGDTETQVFNIFVKTSAVKAACLPNLDAVQLEGTYTLAMLNDIERQFNEWGTQFHEDHLREQFLHLAAYCGTLTGTFAEIGRKMDDTLETNYQSHTDDDYFDIITPLYQFTVFCHDGGNVTLSSQVDVYNHGQDFIGEASCRLDADGHLNIIFTPR